MIESLSDLRVVGEFGTNQEYFPYTNSLRENTVWGSLCIPVFGSWTSNSEFEFLTGDSVAMLPSGTIAYQFYVRPDTKFLVSTLKSQGYEAVAMHPYPAENWNRDKCYHYLGFEKFIAGEDYAGSETIRNYVSDHADFQKIIEMVEQKKHPEDKLFVFNVTMQNHGSQASHILVRLFVIRPDDKGRLIPHQTFPGRHIDTGNAINLIKKFILHSRLMIPEHHNHRRFLLLFKILRQLPECLI